MRTYKELSKDPVVREAAREFDEGPGKRLKLQLSFMRLLRCFTNGCTAKDIAYKAGVHPETLAKLYKTHFKEFVGHDSLQARDNWNRRHRKKTPVATMMTLPAI